MAMIGRKGRLYKFLIFSLIIYCVWKKGEIKSDSYILSEKGNICSFLKNSEGKRDFENDKTLQINRREKYKAKSEFA